MNRFAALLDRLAYERSRLGKLALLEAYFRDTADPDRGWALAAMTASLSFKNAKPSLIRNLAQERFDPTLAAFVLRLCRRSRRDGGAFVGAAP